MCDDSHPIDDQGQRRDKTDAATVGDTLLGEDEGGDHDHRHDVHDAPDLHQFVGIAQRASMAAQRAFALLTASPSAVGVPLQCAWYQRCRPRCRHPARRLVGEGASPR